MSLTTSDLITYLDHTITPQDALYDAVQTALVVGFSDAHGCRMVFHDDPERLEKLDALIHDGGTPIGFIKISRMGSEVALLSRPLSKYSDDPVMTAFFTRLCTGLGEKVAQGAGFSHAAFSEKGRKTPA